MMSPNKRPPIAYGTTAVVATLDTILFDVMDWPSDTYKIVTFALLVLGVVIWVPWMATGKWYWQLLRERPKSHGR